MRDIILALDTSTDACSVALRCDGQIFSHHEVKPRAHNKLLLNMIAGVVQEADIPISTLDAIAFTQGPGSFTGLRMAAGVVQGLAFGANVPVIPMSTLQLLAQSAYDQHGSKNVAIAMDARVDEIYFNTFSLDDNKLMQPTQDDCIISPQNVLLDSSSPWHGVGDGWMVYQKHFPAFTTLKCEKAMQNTYPNAISLLPLAVEKLAKGELLAAHMAQPQYLSGASRWKKRATM